MALFTTCSGSEAYKDAFMERCTPKTGPMVTTNLTPECYAEYVKMYTQFGKLGCTATAPAPTASTATATAPAPTASAATAKCVNTPGWTNGDAYKHPCANYAKVWCDAGKARAGSEWTLGAKWNFPEKNCCVCGKAAFDAKAAKAKATASTSRFPLFTTCSGYENYKDAFMERCTPKTGPMATTNLTPECNAEYVKMYTQFGKLGCNVTAPAPTASTATATSPVPTATAPAPVPTATTPAPVPGPRPYPHATNPVPVPATQADLPCFSAPTDAQLNEIFDGIDRNQDGEISRIEMSEAAGGLKKVLGLSDAICDPWNKWVGDQMGYYKGSLDKEDGK